METRSICNTCEKSIWCPTWTEMKCLAQKKRIAGYKKFTDPAQCKFYRKRGKNFREPKCQCEDCLTREELAGEEG